MSEIDNKEGKLVVTNEMKANLVRASKWGKFLAIMGFIGAGIIVLAAIFFMIAGNSMPGRQMMPCCGAGIVMGICYLIIAAVTAWVSLYLYRFSTNARMAVAEDSQSALGEGVRYWGLYLKLNGIIMIVSIGLAIVLGIIGGIAAASFGM